jgi:hypothetical protein
VNTSELAKHARLARRITGGTLIPDGKCHFCGYKVPPKAHWCSADCAKEYAEETKQIENEMKGK